MNNKRDIQETTTKRGNPASSEVKTIKAKKGIWRTYDGTDGLPPTVRCLLQDRRGYIWLGTMKGLCRYDGVRFITYTTEDGLPANDVRSICEDSQGRLWFGTSGGGVSCCDGENFTNYTTKDGLVSNRISSVYEDSQGRIWFGHGAKITAALGIWSGVSRFDGEQFINYTN